MKNTAKSIADYVSLGKTFAAGEADCCITEAKNTMAEVKKAIGNAEIDPLGIICAHYILGASYGEVADRYRRIEKECGTGNPAVIYTAMESGIDCIIGEEGHRGKPDIVHRSTEDSEEDVFHYLIPLEYVNLKDENGETASSGIGGNRDSWLWTDMAPYIMENCRNAGIEVKNFEFFPKLCYLYCELSGYITTSIYDTETFAFPFTDDEIRKMGGVEYAGAFGEQRDTHVHEGIDLAVNTECRGMPVHAIADGIVTMAADQGWEDWNGIGIDHAGGTFSRYLHCDTVCVSRGQSVSKGDVIGTVGGYGPSGRNHYAVHLHLEYGHGSGNCDHADTDPMTLFGFGREYKLHDVLYGDE